VDIQLKVARSEELLKTAYLFVRGFSDGVRRDRPYRGGRSKDWIKIKNRSHPAKEREF
jgi:ATP-dependent DNA ligase